MRMVVIGGGALGSVVSGYLAEAGVDVTLVARPRHVDAIRRHGLRITGIRGDHEVRRNLTAVADPADAGGDFDCLILCVKGRDTEAALAAAAPLVDRVGAALSLQNSIAKDGRLADWVGPDRVIGAATIEGATLLEPALALNSLTVPTTAYFGVRNGGPAALAQDVADAFDRAGLAARATDRIEQVEWEKLAQVCVASSWSVSTLPALPELALLDGLSVREGAEHYIQLAKEVVAVYRSLGYEPQDFFAPVSRLRMFADADFDTAVDELADITAGRRRTLAKAARTSMHEDVLHRRPTEVEEILGPFVRQARTAGVEAPTLVAAYRTIKTLDRFLVEPSGDRLLAPPPGAED